MSFIISISVISNYFLTVRRFQCDCYYTTALFTSFMIIYSWLLLITLPVFVDNMICNNNII